jgi:7tm Chemosensory receptor
MDKISYLDGVFKVFEVFGHQLFSLKTVFENQKVKTWKKIIKGIYFGATFLLPLSLLLALFVFSFLKYRDSMKNETLNNLLSLFMYGFLFMTINLNILLSWIKNFEYVEFYRTTDEISKLWIRKFGLAVSYKNLRRRLIILSLFQLSFNVLLLVPNVATVFGLSNPSEVLQELFKQCLSTIISLIFLRIVFYIQILNFHLRFLRDNFKERLHPVLDNAPLRGNVDARPFDTRGIIFLRKIYTMIRKMSQQFNRAMGLVITFIFVLSWLIITIYGYKMFMISNVESMAEFRSELNFILIFLITGSFSQKFSPTSCYFWLEL